MKSSLTSIVIACAFIGSAHAEIQETPTQSATIAEDSSIQPFQVHIPEAQLLDLRQRIAATRWPDKETVTDESQGVQLATIQALARYWSTDYDWRKCEAKLNSLPQFTTQIDGLDIQFIHVRSRYPNALPMIITHGWPGSIIELLKVIGPLTDPPAYGGRAEDAFDVVIPSMPGYGFSGKPTTTGWDPAHIARAWTVLMKRLGYTRNSSRKAGIGGMRSRSRWVSRRLPNCSAFTSICLPQCPPTFPRHCTMAIRRQPASRPMKETRMNSWTFSIPMGLGYAIEMKNKPQTLYGIADSPVGLAAWMLDHDARSYELIARAFDGHPGGLTRDDVLDNITLYWLTGTSISSARLYWENKLAFFDPKNVSIPVAVSVFPDEIYAPRAVGPSGRTPSSFIFTSSTRAVTSRHGNSHNSFQKNSGRPSDRCAATRRRR
jgi:pimeloyl-ACP methyl ester carboxylesterase